MRDTIFIIRDEAIVLGLNIAISQSGVAFRGKVEAGTLPELQDTCMPNKHAEEASSTALCQRYGAKRFCVPQEMGSAKGIGPPTITVYRRRKQGALIHDTIFDRVLDDSRIGARYGI